MSNTFYCQLRRLHVSIDKCDQFRVAVDNGVKIDPCKECVRNGQWKGFRETPVDPENISPVDIESEEARQPKTIQKPSKSEPIVEASKAKHCEICGALLGDGNTTGKCKTCYSRLYNYRKGLKCSNCGKPITDYSKTGLCIHCSASRGQKSETVPKTGGETMETIKTHESECVPAEPVETIVIEPTWLMPPESLGAAKIAIERAFQDAERYREIRSLLQDLVDMEENRKATMTRIRELVA